MLRPSHLIVAALLCSAGCGGGTSVPISNAGTRPATGDPSVLSGNAATTYVTYIGQNASGQAFDVAPLGLGASLLGSDAAPGISVVYPDGSSQTTDARGRFDASKSVFAQKNADALLANPAVNPTVLAFTTNALTGATTTLPYPNAAQAAPAVAQIIAQPQAAAVNARDAALQNLEVIPSSAYITTGQSAVFTAVGRYSDGELSSAGLNGLTWSIVRPAGCPPAPSGSVTVDPAYPNRARYETQGTVSFTIGCPDIVTATLSFGPSQTSSSASVQFTAPNRMLSIAGHLVDKSGRSVGNAPIEFYGNSPTTSGTGAITSVSGDFSAKVPADRQITPIVYLPLAHGGFAPSAVTPDSIAPLSAGNGLVSEHWTATGVPPATADLYNIDNLSRAPAPDAAQFIRDEEHFMRTAHEAFPFGSAIPLDGPIAGSLQDVLARPASAVANANDVISGGPFTTANVANIDIFANYHWYGDPTGNVISLGNIASTNRESGVNDGGIGDLLILRRGPAFAGTCPRDATCFGFSRYVQFDPIVAFADVPKPGSALLDSDGTWSQSVSLDGKTFLVSLTENEYDTQHQTPGKPLFVHHLSISQSLVTNGNFPTMAITDAVTLPSGSSVATANWTRSLCTNAAGACALNASPFAPVGAPIFTYSGTLSRTIGRADGSTFSLKYQVAPGPFGVGTFGAFGYADTVTLIASPNPSDVGYILNRTNNGNAFPASGGGYFNGSLTEPVTVGLNILAGIVAQPTATISSNGDGSIQSVFTSQTVDAPVTAGSFPFGQQQISLPY